MKKIFTTMLLSISCFICSNIKAQEAISIHQAESEYYSAHPDSFTAPPSGIRALKNGSLSACRLSKTVVYGFHPYWISDAAASEYHYNLLTHVVYFSGEVDTSGNISTTHSWNKTQLVNYARKNGVKVHLAITMFGSHERVLTSSIKRTKLVKNIVAAMNIRDADGINIDFEGMAKAQALDFRAFITELGSSLKLLNKELAICLPSVDWGGVMFSSAFFSECNPVVDYYFMMGYSYYWKGSPTAGPVAPLTSGTSSWHISRSIRKFLSAGATQQRFISGFPYYGFDWPVVSSTRMAAVSSGLKASSRTYSVAKATTAALAPQDKFFDAFYNVPWYRYQTGTQWHQTWYDDSLSLSKKYDTVKALGIAGTGMWALGYDGNNTELWGAISSAFGQSLPVELASFNGAFEGTRIILRWRTASEINTHKFIIEKFNAGWQQCGEIAAGGTSTEPAEYSFYDICPNAGANSYRLKMVDMDGSFSYSIEISVASSQPSGYSLSQNYPNPFNPSTVIQYQLPAPCRVTLKVYDILGNLTATLVNEQQSAGIHHSSFNIQKYAASSGIYYYMIEAGEFRLTRKMVVLK